jgi:cobalamin biosynthesis Mg chelatase CobN
VLQRAGRESLAVPVCKKKYTPFVFPIVKRTGASPDGRERPAYEVQVVRMYGCKCHHEHRKRVIERYGERKGWEPFGQWSMKKAVELARKESQRLNREAQSAAAPPVSRTCRPPPAAALLATTSSSSSRSTGDLSSTASSDYDDDDDEDSGSDSEVSVRGAGVARNMCLSGRCLWKVKTAYDDVFLELTGQTESEAEDNGTAAA